MSELDNLDPEDRANQACAERLAALAASVTPKPTKPKKGAAQPTDEDSGQ